MHFLDVALDISEGRVAVSLGLHGVVVRDSADGLLSGTLDVVTHTLGVSLGVLGLLFCLGLGLLLGSGSCEALVTEGVSDDLLGTTHGGVVGVGKSVGHVESGWFFLGKCVCVSVFGSV